MPPKLSPISAERFDKFLFFIGCSHVRSQGSHSVYRRGDLSRPLDIPFHDKELPTIVFRTYLRTLGLGVEEHCALLGQI